MARAILAGEGSMLPAGTHLTPCSTALMSIESQAEFAAAVLVIVAGTPENALEVQHAVWRDPSCCGRLAAL